jgi:hypothetical protein
MDSLDELIAEKVLGYTLRRSTFEQYSPSYWVDAEGKTVWEGLGFRPTRDIRAAWHVAEKFNMTVHCVQYSEGTRMWYASDYIGNFFKDGKYTSDTNAPMAICKAALLIMGILKAEDQWK